jgi:hypothetical protein
MSKLRALNPQEGDVVKIKFKTINEITMEYGQGFSNADDEYEFGENIVAYSKGGQFLVGMGIPAEVFNSKDEDDEMYIVVKNHLDHNYNFNVYESTIESIEIVDASETFFSANHELLVVRLDEEMYINGEPLIWNEDSQRKWHDRNKEEYENPNRKLLKLFESFIADLAVRDSFRDMRED